ELDEDEDAGRDPERQGEQAVDLAAHRALGLEGGLGRVLSAGGGQETDADDQRHPKSAGFPHAVLHSDRCQSKASNQAPAAVRALRPSSSWALVSGPVTRCTTRPRASMNTLVGMPRRR